MKSFLAVLVIILMAGVHSTSSLADQPNERKKAYAEKLKKLSEAQAGTIDFYGKVVDQNSNPVSGVVIKYRITPPKYSDWKTIRDELTTDSNGVFNIKGKGVFLTIGMQAHPELAKVYLPRLSENSPVRAELQFRAHDSHGENLADYTKHNPYVINVWRTSKFEKVIASKSSKRYALKSNGEVSTFMNSKALKGPKYRRYRGIAMVPGDHDNGYIRFICERRDEDYAKRSGEWQITLEPIDGGLKKTDDHYRNEAPRLLYSSSLTEKHTGKMLRNQKYYFRSNNKKTYGSMEITYEPFADKNSCHVSINYQINENGSRNLAVKP